MLSTSDTQQVRITGIWRATSIWLRRRRALRRAVLAGVDLPLLAIAAVAGYGLAMAWTDADVAWNAVLGFALLGVASKLPVMGLLGVYDVDWRHSDLRDMVLVGRALTLGSLVLVVAAIGLQKTAGFGTVPALALVLDFLLAVILIDGSRAVSQVISEGRRMKTVSPASPRTRVLIMGAGDAGSQVARALHDEARSQYEAVGFVDDDPAKRGNSVRRVKILGSRADMPEIARRVRADELWIAMPSAPGSAVQEVLEAGRAAGIKQIKVVPGLTALMTGRIKLTDIREVQFEELLGRDPVRVDTTRVSELLRGHRVIVTGAAGSIGAELCAQVAKFDPELIVVLDQDETGVFDVERALVSAHPGLRVEAVIGDVRDEARVDDVFRTFKPEVVFHAAAYKHVPLMEVYPDQAIRTNVFGTRSVARAAMRCGARKFVLISTDKAVNPTSIMGATKRAAEVLVQQLDRTGPTQFVAVRFGNVLGSRGSVVPIFREQIARGGPVTVTDPEMKRYFMTIPEAVLLVLQAGAMGDDGQVMALDMGRPVRIVDLARQMIKLSGLEPDRDIQIVYTGIRPGEKLFEDILHAEEGTVATCHDRIFIARVCGQLTASEFEERVAAMETAISSGRREDMIAALRRMVSTYRPPRVTSVHPSTQPAMQPAEQPLTQPAMQPADRTPSAAN